MECAKNTELLVTRDGKCEVCVRVHVNQMKKALERRMKLEKTWLRNVSVRVEFLYHLIILHLC